jgi:hypothetical protein
MARRIRTLLCLCVAVAFIGAMPGASIGDDVTEDERTARSLATMLRAARTVISNNQDLINNEKLGDKGLTADKVLAR